MPLASPAAAALLTQNPAESEALLASSSSYRNTHNRGPSMSVAPLAAPTQAEAMQRFIDTEDLTCLEKPLVFETNRQQFKKLLCLQGALVSVLGFGMSVPFVPVASCCPYTYADEFSLRLDKDAITFQAAANDCCW
jgi:hypothetical protein